jgi:hypothetical protein
MGRNREPVPRAIRPAHHPLETRLQCMGHLAEREERHHERNEVNEPIVGRVAHHEVHQHVNADSREDEKKNTRHSGGRARLLLTEGYQRRRVAAAPHGAAAP